MVSNKIIKEIDNLNETIYSLIDFLKDSLNSNVTKQYETLASLRFLLDSNATSFLLDIHFNKNNFTFKRLKRYLNDVIRRINELMVAFNDNSFMYIKEKAVSLLVLLEMERE